MIFGIFIIDHDLNISYYLKSCLRESLTYLKRRAFSYYEYGNAFEAFVITEIHRLNLYYKKDWQLSYLRTKDHLEIDLLIERPGQPLALIEIKSSQHVGPDDVRSLARIGKDLKEAELFCLSLDPIAKEINHVQCHPWQEGLKQLGLL